MLLNNIIEHEGIIAGIGKSKIKVAIQVADACESCKIKNICSVTGSKEKYFEVPKSNSPYQIGERVLISISKPLAYRALFLSYVLPLCLVLFVLFAFSIFVKNEATLVLLSLSVLLPYYLALYGIRHYLDNKFSVRLTKIDLKTSNRTS